VPASIVCKYRPPRSEHPRWASVDAHSISENGTTLPNKFELQKLLSQHVDETESAEGEQVVTTVPVKAAKMTVERTKGTRPR
jgi:hypothetical protein